ncbi:MAG: hypothetical protein EKK40_12305 [Bradyrhizobiaceae bacterium]|nr:MAG: hypothetical protein EKK40_12305 [Bradyrhizobiaceae bacterium]
MSQRIDKSWVVFASVEDDDNRCVDFFARPDGTFGFEEFRRDSEDGGRWTPTQHFSGAAYSSPAQSLGAAEHSVRWLGDVLARKPLLRDQIRSPAP